MTNIVIITENATTASVANPRMTDSMSNELRASSCTILIISPDCAERKYSYGRFKYASRSLDCVIKRLLYTKRYWMEYSKVRYVVFKTNITTSITIQPMTKSVWFVIPRFPHIHAQNLFSVIMSGFMTAVTRGSIMDTPSTSKNAPVSIMKKRMITRFLWCLFSNL